MKVTNPRIVAGHFKNRRLKVPESARPLTDRIRQSVFDTISEFLPDAICLDLYAGAGTTGLEALSRGAKSCTFVEKDPAAANIIKENIAVLGLNTTVAQVFTQKNAQFLSKNPTKFDIIFADPPFNEAHKFKITELAGHLQPDGMAVIRMPANTKLNTNSDSALREELNLVQTNTYGESKVYFFTIMQ